MHRHTRGPWYYRYHFLLIAVLCATPGCDDPVHRPLRVGLLVWPAYELYYLADDMGIYPPEAIALLDFPSPAEAMRAFRTGNLDAVLLTQHFFMSLAAEDSAVIAVQVADISSGADALLAHPDIAGLSDLAGRRIAVEKSPLGAYILRRVLETAGLDMADITPVSIDVAGHVDAYLSGRVDAVVTYEPHRSRLLDHGAVELLSSTDLDMEISDLLLVRRPLSERKTAALRTLIDGWFQARAYLKATPEAAIRRMAKRGVIRADELAVGFAGMILPDTAKNRAMLGADSSAYIRGLRIQAERMHLWRLIEHRPELSGRLTPAYLPGSRP